MMLLADVHARRVDGKENSARLAALAASCRVAASKKKEKKERVVVARQGADDPVALARRRIAAYAKKQKAPAVQRRPQTERWYSVAVARRLSRLERAKALSNERRVEKRQREIRKNVDRVATKVTQILRGHFGVFLPGSYLLRKEEPPRSPPRWRSPLCWIPGPYNNPILTSHDGPRLSHNRFANHRLFGPRKKGQRNKKKELFQLAVDLWKKKNKKLTMTNPNWRRALLAIKKDIFRRQVHATRSRLLGERIQRNDDGDLKESEHADDSVEEEDSRGYDTITEAQDNTKEGIITEGTESLVVFEDSPYHGGSSDAPFPVGEFATGEDLAAEAEWPSFPQEEEEAGVLGACEEGEEGDHHRHLLRRRSSSASSFVPEVIPPPPPSFFDSRVVRDTCFRSKAQESPPD